MRNEPGLNKRYVVTVMQFFDAVEAESSFFHGFFVFVGFVMYPVCQSVDQICSPFDGSRPAQASLRFAIVARPFFKTVLVNFGADLEQFSVHLAILFF